MVKLKIEKMRFLDSEHGFLQGSFDTRSFPIFFFVSKAKQIKIQNGLSLRRIGCEYVSVVTSTYLNLRMPNKHIW